MCFQHSCILSTRVSGTRFSYSSYPLYRGVDRLPPSSVLSHPVSLPGYNNQQQLQFPASRRYFHSPNIANLPVASRKLPVIGLLRFEAALVQLRLLLSPRKSSAIAIVAITATIDRLTRSTCSSGAFSEMLAASVTTKRR